MNDRELLEYIAAQVGNLTTDIAEVKSEMKSVKNEMHNLKQDVAKTNMLI